MRGLPGGCACGGDQGRGENRELPQGAQTPGSGADAAPGIAPAPVTACQWLVLRSRNHARRRARRKHWRRTGLACRRPWNEHIWNIRLQQWPSIASSMQAGSRRHATMCDTGKSFWFRPTRQSIRGPALRSPETLRLGLRRPGSYACETRPAQLVGIAMPGEACLRLPSEPLRAVGHRKGQSAAKEPRNGLTRRSQRPTRCLICRERGHYVAFRSSETVARSSSRAARVSSEASLATVTRT